MDEVQSKALAESKAFKLAGGLDSEAKEAKINGMVAHAAFYAESAAELRRLESENVALKARPILIPSEWQMAAHDALKILHVQQHVENLSIELRPELAKSPEVIQLGNVIRKLRELLMDAAPQQPQVAEPSPDLQAGKQVRKIVVSGIERLDPVTVYLEDLEDGVGKIMIECYGKAWSAHWGSMGKGCDIADFFISCDSPYLIGRLDSNLQSTVFDPDGLRDRIKAEVIKQRRSGKLKNYEARDLLDEAEHISEIQTDNVDLMCRVWGVSFEWWHDSPEMPNPDYEYLERIVKAVQDALRKMKEEDAAEAKT